MFISLPKVFNEMGIAGDIVGLIFFMIVAFAAVTSSVSIMELLYRSYRQISLEPQKKRNFSHGIRSDCRDNSLPWLQ